MSLRDQTEENRVGVLLMVGDSGSREQTSQFLDQLGYLVQDEVADDATPEIVVVAAGPSMETSVPSELSEGEYPPPVVVFGPANSSAWRKEALEAGAFACLSWEAPFEERASLLAAASRFRAAQREIETIREESDFLMTRLLQTYGEEAQKLQIAVEERKEIKEDLDKIRARILRSIL